MTRRWLIDLPTRIHLWSAEFELRHRSSAHPERLRNLGVLREYRRSRAFPRNDTGLRSTPYFVDSAGRHCAVGHLMRESGADHAVRRIAAEANLARIDDMDPAVLADWTERSGLTKRELARIQPNYPSGSQWAVDLLLWSALLMIPFALLSFVLGRLRLDRIILRRSLVVAVVGSGTVLTALTWREYSQMDGLGPGLIEDGAWCVALVGPIFAAVVIAFLARDGRIAFDGVGAVSGVLTGALMTLFAAAYLVVDIVVPDPTDLPGGPPDMGPDEPVLWALPAVVALVLGVLTLTWAVRSFRSLDSRA